VLRAVRSPETLFGLAILAAAVGGALILWVFGNEPYLVELGSGFGASLLAFVVALSWERRREQRELEREIEREQRELEREIEREEERAKEEIRRRLIQISNELKGNERAIEALLEELAKPGSGAGSPFVPVPQLLLDGAWKANAPSLGLILEHFLADDLRIIYGELDELRLRVRYRARAQSHEFDSEIEELAARVKDKLLGTAAARGLIERVEEASRSPSLDYFTPYLRRDLVVTGAARFREAVAKARARARAERAGES
jgi:hypothetical protein